MKNWKSEIAVYCAFCVVSAIALVTSLKYGLGNIGELGPGLLPFATTLCVFVFGIILIFTTLSRRKEEKPAARVEKVNRVGWIRVGGILLSLAVWPMLVNLIGYIISTFIVSLGMGKTIGYKGWLNPLLLSAGVAFTIWFIFGFMFNVDLPAGPSS